MRDLAGHCQTVTREMLRTLCILGIPSGLASISAGMLTAQAPSARASPTSAPDSQASRVYGPEDHGVTTPKLIYAPDPEYSDKARRQKLNGSCVLSVLVDVKGNPQDVQVVKSVWDGVNSKQRSAAMSLDQKAMETARKYRFKPATLNGEPVPYKVKLEMNFRIY